jgi:hypothetical protein
LQHVEIITTAFELGGEIFVLDGREMDRAPWEGGDELFLYTARHERQWINLSRRWRQDYLTPAVQHMNIVAPAAAWS